MLGCFGMALAGTMVVAPPANAGAVDVLGATVTWDDSTMYLPEGCSRFTFNYSNGSGIRLLRLGFQIADQYGDVITWDSQIGINPGITGNWSKQICSSAVASSGLGPYTLTVEIKDYAGSVRNGSAPFIFIERPVPPPSAPQGVAASIANRDGSVSWTAPATNAASAREYIVTDVGANAEVCRVPAATLSCPLSALADGPHAFVVSAASAGNAPVASGPTPTFTVGPPIVKAPPRVSKMGTRLRLVMSTDMGSTAVATQLIAKTGAGKNVCAVKVSDADRNRGFAECFAKRPKAATRYAVTAVTPLGVAIGPLTRPIR